MRVCKDCIHYEICDKYVAPDESFPEVNGCKCFKAKADVVEVVRCKDCKYFTEEMIGDDLEGICKSVSGMLNPAPDFYCSYGERREE